MWSESVGFGWILFTVFVLQRRQGRWRIWNQSQFQIKYLLSSFAHLLFCHSRSFGGFFFFFHLLANIKCIQSKDRIIFLLHRLWKIHANQKEMLFYNLRNLYFVCVHSNAKHLLFSDHFFFLFMNFSSKHAILILNPYPSFGISKWIPTREEKNLHQAIWIAFRIGWRSLKLILHYFFTLICILLVFLTFRHILTH